MSPVNIFRPRGFGGGYDTRFMKRFQPGSTGGVIDPNAAHISARSRLVAFRYHAQAAHRQLIDHAVPAHVEMAAHVGVAHIEVV